MFCKKTHARGLSAVVIIALVMSLFAMPMFASADEPVTGTIVYNANGGSGGTTVSAAQTYAFPATTRSGFKLTGWYTEKFGGTQLTNGAAVNFGGKSSITVYAQWSKSVTVKFNPNKGILKKKSQAGMKKTFSSKYGTLPKVTRSGYRFRGWFSGNTKITKNSYVQKSKAHTLKAKWIKKGKGKTVTSAEYKQIKKGMSYADVKYAVGAKSAMTPEIVELEGVEFTEYAWGYDSSKTQTAHILTVGGKVVWKGKGTDKQLRSGMTDFFIAYFS